MASGNEVKCPACGGLIEVGYRKCKHCSSDLLWNGSVPSEPAEDSEHDADEYEEYEDEDEGNEDEAEDDAERVGPSILWFLVIAVVLAAIFVAGAYYVGICVAVFSFWLLYIINLISNQRRKNREEADNEIQESEGAS